MNRRGFLTSCAALGVSGSVARLIGQGAAPSGAADVKGTPPLELGPILKAMRAAVQSAQIEEGRYARYIGSARQREPDGGSLNPYGCADSAMILYTLDEIPRDPQARQAWITALQSMQDPATGLYHERTQPAIHTTADCAAALELFEARPAYPLTALHRYLDHGELVRFLDQLPWVKDPWHEGALNGAGLYAALINAREVDQSWTDVYFDWLAHEQDPETGLWRRGCQTVEGTPPIFEHMAGSFHYLFNHQFAHRPLQYPDRMIDTCLRIQAQNLRPTLGRAIGFTEVDWIYCLTRARRQSGYRFAEVSGALEAMARRLVGYLHEQVATRGQPFEDMHRCLGCICALAELQAEVPGMLRSERPLRLVLDRRPFI